MELYIREDGQPFRKVARQDFAQSNRERTLEDWLSANPHLIGTDIMLIGRQVRTPHGIIDLLAVDRYGAVLVIELKRGRGGSRGLVGQLNSYLTIVRGWSEDILAKKANLIPPARGSAELLARFREHFSVEAPEFNSKQVGVVIASSFDPDFIDHIGGLRFDCRILQFSNFLEKGKEYLLVENIHNSAAFEQKKTNKVKTTVGARPIKASAPASATAPRPAKPPPDNSVVGRLKQWISQVDKSREFIPSNEVLKLALSGPERSSERNAAIWAAQLLRSLGWRPGVKWLNGRPVRGYFRATREDDDRSAIAELL